MTDTPDPALVREIANTAIGYVTHDYVRQRFAECALTKHGINEHDIQVWSAYYDAVIADISCATAVGTWAGDQKQWAIWSCVQGGWRADDGYTIDPDQAARFTAREARTLIDDEAHAGLADGKPRSLMVLGPEVRTDDNDVTVMNARLKWAFQNEMRKYGPDGRRTDLAPADATEPRGRTVGEAISALIPGAEGAGIRP